MTTHGTPVAGDLVEGVTNRRSWEVCRPRYVHDVRNVLEGVDDGVLGIGSPYGESRKGAPCVAVSRSSTAAKNR